MAWEDRNGNSYYYRKRRVGKHVVSEYIGGGFIGELAEVIDMEQRCEEDKAHAEWLKQKGNAQLMDEQIGEIEKYTKAVTRATLLISGYHPHKRQWRKHRNVSH